MNLDLVNEKGESLLYHTCNLDSAISLWAVEALLEAGANVNLRNHNGHNSLNVCLYDERLIEILLKFGIERFYRKDRSEFQYSDIALRKGLYKVFSLLLSDEELGVSDDYLSMEEERYSFALICENTYEKEILYRLITKQNYECAYPILFELKKRIDDFNIKLLSRKFKKPN